MLNKILGVTLIVIAVILALAFLIGLPGLFSQLINTISDSSAYSWGLVLGNLTASLVLGAVVFLLFRFGLKLYNKPS
ncbi:MAG: hypothetical protein ABJN84_12850 [Flavobacteriaceae bacterium]